MVVGAAQAVDLAARSALPFLAPGLSALGPLCLGLLTSKVFVGYPEPMRYAGVSICSVFIIALISLPFAPETKGQPLPECFFPPRRIPSALPLAA